MEIVSLKQEIDMMAQEHVRTSRVCSLVRVPSHAPPSLQLIRFAPEVASLQRFPSLGQSSNSTLLHRSG
eukprot:2544124-Pyramimonas_sp.AAC.1